MALLFPDFRLIREVSGRKEFLPGQAVSRSRYIFVGRRIKENILRI